MILFREEQRFYWLRIPLVVFVTIMSFFMLSGLYQQLVLGTPWGNNPMNDTLLILVNIGTLLIIWLVFYIIFSARLETSVTRDGIEFRFPPFFRKNKKISAQEIESWEVKKYNPILEYGGYGIRIGFGRKKAYNTWGNQGLQLILTDGKHILIGTQKPAALAMAMKKMKSSGTME